LEAEQLLASHPLWAQRHIVLRLAGIYGPGRVPRRDDILAGRAIPSPSDGYLNLIHVDDAVAAILAADAHAPLPSRYNVSDGHPVIRRTYFEALAKLYAADPPRFVPADPRTPKTQRGGTDKRVRNSRLLHDLSVQLQYPDYCAGLKSIVAGE
jgi:nucleoside-diphosphate-sugar epimerase